MNEDHILNKFYLIAACGSPCTKADWGSSFDHAGLSSCPATHLYITGLERSRSNDYNRDYIFHIEGAQCCKATVRYDNRDSDCVQADWVASFDKCVSI